MSCEEFKRVHDPDCRERCDRKTWGYVVSGPMFVCWSHALHWEKEGEVIVRV